MYKLFIILAACAVTAVLCFGSGTARADGLPFLTIEEFIAAHPRQSRLMQDFDRVVRGPARLIDRQVPTQVRVAFVYPSKQISDYWRRSITAFKSRMTEIGIPFIIDEYYSTPNDEQDVQERQIRQALSNDPDYLIFTLDAFKHKQLIEHILNRGRPKVILQNITTPLRGWEGNQPFMYVGFDHAIGTRILADYLMKRTGGYGGYGMLYFTHGYVSTMRGVYFRQYVSRKSGLRQVDVAYTDGQEARAEEAAARMLRNDDLKFLYACSTDIALGAVKAIRDAGLTGSVLVNGWGGGSAELEAIRRGDLDVTVMRMNDDNGVAMAEGIRMDVEGKTEAVPTIFSGEMVLVEKGINKKAFDTLIRRAFRYSGH